MNEPTIFYLFHDGSQRWLADDDGPALHSRSINDACEFDSAEEAEAYNEAHDGEYMVLGWFQ